MSRKAVWTIAALMTLLLIGVVLVFFLKPQNEIVTENHRPSSFVGFGEIVPDKDGSLSQDFLNHSYDLEPFEMVSDNEDVVKLGAYLMNNLDLIIHPDIEINHSEDDDTLSFKGKKIFNAAHIYNASVSNSGRIAVEAITKSEYPTYKNPQIDFDKEKKFLPVNYGEIWIIESGEKPYKVSAKNINATNPCISNNGKMIAYTANAIDQTNSRINEFLVVHDLETGQSKHYNSSNMDKDHYTISPVMWLRDDTVLRTTDDWGETGGHGEIGYIILGN